MELQYDIAIIGGGPAGLSAAYSAAKAGARVALFEKDDAIAHSVRTSGVSWIDSMESLGIPSNYYNPISSYRFVSPSNDIKISGSSPRSCVLDVRSTYQYLATLAASEGADILIRSSVTGVLMQDGAVVGLSAATTRGNLSIKSTLVIDASGFHSMAARRAGIATEWKRYGVGAEYECYCDCADSSSWTLMVGNQYSDAGYAWIFPLSPNRVRIGVGIGRPESSSEPLERLNSLMESRPRPIDSLGKIQPLELHVGFIPNEGVRRATVADGLLLVGDSAGQSNPLVLEGIRYAIEFGRLAGRVGAESLGSRSTRESLMPYERSWREKVESKIASALKVQSRWLGLTDEQWDKEIEILKDMSADEFIDFIKAEFTTAKMMKLALHHPRMAARQLFNMVVKP